VIAAVYLAAAVLATSSAARSTLPIPEDVQIAAFRSELVSNKDLVRCLQTNGVDPKRSVLEAATLPDTIVVPGSACVRVMDPRRGSFHRSTGKPAVFLSMGAFRRIDDSVSELHIVSYRHGKWAEGATLTLKRTADGWSVTTRRSEWIA